MIVKAVFEENNRKEQQTNERNPQQQQKKDIETDPLFVMPFP
jgi:hypothetical protein